MEQGFFIWAKGLRAILLVCFYVLYIYIYKRSRFSKLYKVKSVLLSSIRLTCFAGVYIAGTGTKCAIYHFKLLILLDFLCCNSLEQSPISGTKLRNIGQSKPLLRLEMAKKG